jgi:hypothetical protein
MKMDASTPFCFMFRPPERVEQGRAGWSSKRISPEKNFVSFGFCLCVWCLSIGGGQNIEVKYALKAADLRRRPFIVDTHTPVRRRGAWNAGCCKICSVFGFTFGLCSWAAASAVVGHLIDFESISALKWCGVCASIDALSFLSARFQRTQRELTGAERENFSPHLWAFNQDAHHDGHQVNQVT